MYGGRKSARLSSPASSAGERKNTEHKKGDYIMTTAGFKSTKGLFKLSHKIALIIPTTIKGDIEAPKKLIEQERRKACIKLSTCFGGATSTACRGYYMSRTGKGLIEERNILIYAYAQEKELDEHIQEIVELCLEIKEEMEQESIFFELDGEAYLI